MGWRCTGGSLSDIYAVSVDGSGLRQVIDSKLTGAVVPPCRGLSELKVEVTDVFWPVARWHTGGVFQL